MEKIDTIIILLIGSAMIKFHNIALRPNCNSNLILLDQSQKSEITYYDNATTMTLMQIKKIVAHVRRKQNLFMLDLATFG